MRRFQGDEHILSYLLRYRIGSFLRGEAFDNLSHAVSRTKVLIAAGQGYGFSVHHQGKMILSHMDLHDANPSLLSEPR